MRVIGVDYETYYDKEVSIKPLGIDGYIRHPLAKPYMVSMYSEDMDTGEVTLDYSGSMEDAPWKELVGAHVVSHNARFDESVQLYHLGGAIPAWVKPGKYSCTADLSVYLSGPRSLLGACEQLLQVKISKAYRGTALGKGAGDFTDSEWEEIAEAGRQDSKHCFLLWKHFHKHWPEREQEVSRINREMGRRGIYVNQPLLDEAINKVGRALWEVGQKFPWDWGGKVSKTPLSPKKIAEQCRREGIPFPSSFAEKSEECQEWEELYSDDYEWIAALRDWRKANIFLGKLQHIKSRIREDGTYPYCLKYNGAHTGRFSGDGGFNMQNMYRDARFGYRIRHMFIPRPGFKFLIADYAQIEARLLIWVIWKLQGCPEAGVLYETLQMVQKGISVYEVHAIQTMGWDPKKGSLKVKDPELYKLAKARVLALGYGCGDVKFQAMAFALVGLRLDLDVCKRTVHEFRNTNRDITDHWSFLHRNMLAATRKPNRMYLNQLPSQRALTYFNVTGHGGMQAQTSRGGHSGYFYGGKLAENEIQAVGSDVLKDAMVACDLEVPEYPMVLDVHDEIVFEVPEGISEKEILKIDALMVGSSPWAIGLPLDIEWELTDKYKK